MTLRSTGTTALQAVLLDFGGVIAEEGFRDALRNIGIRNGHDPEKFFQAGRDIVYGSGYVTGHSDEVAFWRTLTGRFPVAESWQVLTAEVLERFVLRAPMMELVRSIRRRGLLCGLLSDQTDWLDRLDRRDHFYRVFDCVYNSYRLGMSKRDARVFDRVVADMGLEPAAVLFVDDSADHVARARSRGVHGLLFKDIDSTVARVMCRISASARRSNAR